MIKSHLTLPNYGTYILPKSNRAFFNKYEAIMAATAAGEWVEWDYNDAFFSKQPWQIEPAESLDQLYAARCKELREKYDYLVLHLSGGWDSGQALEAFMDSNTLIDEIITRGAIPDKIDHTDRSAANCYAECIISALPKAKIAQEKWPHMKITVANTKQMSVDFFSKDKDWFTKINQIHVGIHRFDLDLLSPHALAANKQNKSVCHIISVDKPRMHKVGDRYYWRFLDLLTQIHFAERLSPVDLPMNVELFYWSPTPAGSALMRKQGHVMKRYFKATGVDPEVLAGGRKNNDTIASIVYPNIKYPAWNTEKPSDIPEFDHWFYKDQESAHFKNWHNGLLHMAANIPVQYQNKGNAAKHGLIGFWSKSYDLGE